MKKTLTLILTLLIAAAASGCNKIQDTLNTAQEGFSSEAEPVSENENEEEHDNAVTSKKKYKKVYITDTNKKDKNKNDPDNSSQKDDDSSAGDNNDDNGNNGAEIGGYSVDYIYESAVEMYNRVLRSCPYELDYDDTDANGFAAISDPDVTGTDDVVSKYCTVFAEPDSYIYEKYIEKDGKVYYNDAARGSNIYYSGTDLEYVSGDESNMTFNAVSHYRDPETGEALEDKTAVFSVKLTDDGYRVTEFKYPQ